MPGVSTWAVSAGGELHVPLNLFQVEDGEAYVGLEAFKRSKFSSDASNSDYTQVDGYATVNPRAGFRTGKLDAYLWSTNLTDEEYLLFSSAQAGNSGLVIGLPGDPRAIGATLRLTY